LQNADLRRRLAESERVESELRRGHATEVADAIRFNKP
jgi:hypothetical protein